MRPLPLTRRHLGAALLALAVAPPAQSFVLLSRDGEHLNITPDSPTFHFSWDGTGPTLTDKSTFRGGAFANATNEQAILAMLQEAAATWSSVTGSYLKFTVSEVTTPLSIDPSDDVNAIVFAHDPNLSDAGYTVPTVSNNPPYDGRTVTDCDIHLTKISTTMQGLLQTATHEMGHCVGLGHPHTNYHAIMSYSHDTSSADLGADDIAGLIYLYPDPMYSTKVRNAVPLNCATVAAARRVAAPGLLLLFAAPLLLVALGPRRPVLRADGQGDRRARALPKRVES